MSLRDTIEQKAEELITPILQENGFEIVDMEYVKEGANYYLRAYIDKEDGITVEDCVFVSRAFETKLDEVDLIEAQYILEVSSPGLGRQLKKDRDFLRHMGEEVELKLYKAIDKQKEYTGILNEFNKDSITIELEDGTKKEFQRNDIAIIKQRVIF